MPVTLHSISCPDGDLDCIGDFQWTNVPPGDTKQDTFTIKNIGPENSLLDWEIVSYPSWGMWSFTAEKGKDLENEKNISFAVTVPKNKDKEFSGEILVNPVPQALMLTAIVIGVSITALALALIVKIYEKYKSLDIQQLLKE